MAKRNKVSLIISASGKAAAKEIASFAKKTKKEFAGISKSVFSLQGALAGGVAGYGLKELADGFIEVSASAEKTKFMLEGLGASSSQAQSQFEWIQDFAAKAPIDLAATKDAFTKLTIAGLDPMAGRLQTLTDAISAFGGGSESMKRATVAIMQMSGKGVISMEELRQQLGEAVPDALKVMSREMGMTMRDFTAQVSKGAVDAKTGLDALFRGWEKAHKGASQRMMSGWSGLMSALRTEWDMFRIKVMDSGPFGALKQGLQDVLDKIQEMKKTGELDTWATDLANAVLDSIDLMIAGFGALSQSISGVRASIGWTIEKLAHMGAQIENGTWEANKARIKLKFDPDNEGAKKTLADTKVVVDRLKGIEQAGRDMAAGNMSAIGKVSDAVGKLRDRLAGLRKEQQAPTKWKVAGGIGMKIPKPPSKPKAEADEAPGIDPSIFKKFGNIHAAVVDKINQRTLSSTNYKKAKLKEWYDASAATYKAAEKGPEELAELTKAYTLELAAIEKEAAEGRGALAREMNNGIREMAMNEFEFKRTLLAQEITEAQEKAAGDKALMDLITAYKKGKILEIADAEAKAKEAALLNAQSLAEQRFAVEHQVINSLREAWGLTFDEIGAKQVNVWADIGMAMANMSKTAAGAFSNVVMGSKTAGEALKGLFKSILSQTIGTLIQIGVQRVILSAIQKTALGAETAAMVISMNAISKAAWPAAIATSLATAGASAATGTKAFTIGVGSMSAVAMATKGMFAGMKAMATGGYVDRPTNIYAGEDGREVVIPLTPKYRTQGQALFNEIAPIFAPTMPPAPVMPGGQISPPPGLPHEGVGEAAYAQGGPSINISIGDIIVNGNVADEVDAGALKDSIGDAVGNAIRGALN